MALFRRKRESEAQPGTSGNRSKRGGVRRQTQEINIDLSALDKGAAPAPAQPATRARGGQSKRVVTPTTPSVSARRSSRSSGRGTPIGELLIQAAAINTEQLTKALRIQEKQGGLIGQVLVSMGACAPEDIAEALGKQFRFTQVDLKRIVPQPSALVLFEGPRCLEHKLIPFERIDQMLCVAMVNVLNRKAITQVESLTQMKVKAFSSVWADIQTAIEKFYTPEINEISAKVQTERLNDAGKALKLADELTGEMAPPALEAPETEAAAAPQAAAAPAAPPKPSSEELAKKFINDAGTLRSRGRLEDAVKRLEIGAAKLPDAQIIKKALAQLRREMDEKRAADATRHAKVAELLAAGRAAHESGDPETAFESFNEAAQLDPQNNVVAREIAAVQKDIARVKAERAAQRKLGQEAKLADEKRKGVAEAKKQVQIAELLALAKAAQKAGRLQEAESRLQDVLALDESHAVAAAQLAQVQNAIQSKERQLKDTIRTALQAAERLTESAKFDQARSKLQEAIDVVGEDPGLVAAMHDIDAAVRQKDKLDDAAKRRQDLEKQEIQAHVRALIDQAAGAESSGDLEQAEQLLEDALALDPDNVEAIAKVGEVREAIRNDLDEHETRRRAGEERRKHEDEISARMREATQDREAGRLELAQHKLQSINETDPGRPDVREALAALEKDLEVQRQDEDKRLQKEEEERRRIEESLRQRAAAAAEASADRVRTEAAVGGEQRLDAGSVSEENLITIDLTPEAQLASVADAVSRRTGGGVSSTTEALRRLPVGQIYAKSIEDLRKLAAAAQAVDAAMADLDVDEPGAEDELELELEPTLDAQPPMPDLEAQLEAEPEAILEALPVDDETEADDMLEAEIADPVEERLTAKPMSDAEFEGLRSQLEPDPAQEWWDCFASGGPVPAVPIED